MTLRMKGKYANNFSIAYNKSESIKNFGTDTEYTFNNNIQSNLSYTKKGKQAAKRYAKKKGKKVKKY